VTELEFLLFTPGFPEHPRAALVYETWRNGWQQTLAELGVEQVHSDEFVRQDEVLALFRAETCIALTALRWLDRTQASGRDDSYFQCWPETALDVFGRSVVGISSNTFVAPDWRRCRVTFPDGADSDAIGLSLLTLVLAARRVAESPGRFMLGVARNERSMNRVAAALGGRTLGQTLVHREVSDLICIPSAEATTRGKVADWLWDRRDRA
jgi:hypothetical protein